jgi:hypothetical protein
METGRIKAAVEFLKDGQSLRVFDLRLGIEGNTITVTGWSQYSYIENLTKHQALTELNDIKTLFKFMSDSSLELRSFILDKKVEYNLYFDDYGKGSIIICSEMDGAIKWEMEIPP